MASIIHKKLWAEQRGFTMSIVDRWIKHIWVEGDEFIREKDDVFINTSLADDWLIGARQPRERPPKQPKAPKLMPPRKPFQDAPTALYRHFDASGRLLYVGIALSPLQRLASHQQSTWCNDIVRIEIVRFSTRDEAISAERSARKSENPLHNRMHNAASN